MNLDITKTESELFIPIRSGFHCRLLAYFDNATNRFHLLDLNGDITLTNAIDDVQYAIMTDYLPVEKRFLPIEWILYHTDAVISRYEKMNFSFLSPDSDQVYPPYVELMNKKYGQ